RVRKAGLSPVGRALTSYRGRRGGRPLQGEAVARVPLRGHPGGAPCHGVKRGQRENGGGSVSDGSGGQLASRRLCPSVRPALPPAVPGVDRLAGVFGLMSLVSLEKREGLEPTGRKGVADNNCSGPP